MLPDDSRGDSKYLIIFCSTQSERPYNTTEKIGPMGILLFNAVKQQYEFNQNLCDIFSF